MTTLGTVADQMWDAVRQALWPTQCVGCGQWDTPLCPQCQSLATSCSPWTTIDGPGIHPGLGVWTLGEYDGALRRVVLAAKHSMRIDLRDFLTQSGLTLGSQIAVSGILGHARLVWVVPAPSGWRRRHQGMLIAPTIAIGVAQAIAAHLRIRCEVVDAVRLRFGTTSQSGKSAGDRRAGRAGSMLARITMDPQCAVVLVDDVMTTGATIGELARVCGPGTVAVAALCRAVSATTRYI